ncbi:riboflavin kinase [Rothia halotolerans]|uniref:riboflavin kinase n=1 Tax=Rothia halotolerans TaxID=405770 RepID=UPI00101C437E|nr:riboflavin kinase [Rothia halotolerans]
MITVTGTVVPGDQRGRVLGFPTANIAVSERSDLDGVWAGTVEFSDGSVNPAAVSIGRRRTFYDADGELLLEAFLIGYSGDLYGLTLRVHLQEFLRGQEGFPSIEALTEQMHRDVARTLGALGWPQENAGAFAETAAAVSAGTSAAVSTGGGAHLAAAREAGSLR